MKMIQGIQIEDSNYVMIQGARGHYEAIVWATESDSVGSDGANAISRTKLTSISDDLSMRADADNSF